MISTLTFLSGGPNVSEVTLDLAVAVLKSTEVVCS